MSTIQRTLTQTVAKAAAKTFLQAFLGVLAVLAVPVLTSWSTTIGNGGELAIDVGFFVKVAIAALGAGIAALISLAWNWSKTA